MSSTRTTSCLPEDPRRLSRREFLALSAGATALGALGWPECLAAREDGWNAGQLMHLIPTASHDRFLIKASFRQPLQAAPQLAIGGRLVEGARTDPDGRFWRFDVASLSPATQYELRIVDPGGAPLCDAWPLKTFPAPDSVPERLRILCYTCAGGYDGKALEEGKTTWLDMGARRRLLAKAMSFHPDVVIANGDHIYWDQLTSLNKGAEFARHVRANFWDKFGGPMDLSVPMLHPRNRPIFLGVCDYQIPGLYGTALRSTPSFFLTDDHDNFENDEFDATLAALPPDSYGTVGAEQTQHLYYPEFLPDRNQPEWLPGGDKASAPAGTNICFGTLRYGKLLEVVLYDCRRYLDQKGQHAKVVPQWVEDWLVARTRAEDTVHFMHCPSLPFGYSSGKLGDWYPDALDPQAGKLVMYRSKPGWQSGWLAQHQRLIAALAAQRKRQPVLIQGDFHASSAGKILRSGELRMARPVHAILTGTLGTGDMAFPSSFRKLESTPSQLVSMDEALKATEKNGFTIIDVSPDRLRFSLFLWRPPQSVELIDRMEPALVYEVPR